MPEHDDPGFVGFTNKEILIRLEVKVDKVLDDHESRIRFLEKVQYGIPASLVVALAGLIAVFIR